MSVSITEVFDAEDLRETARIANISWTETYVPIIGREQTEYMIEKFQSYDVMLDAIEQGQRYYLISFERTHCGYFCLAYENDKVFLSKLYVLKEFQRKGIATSAFEFIKILCDGRKIYLTVNRNNLKAISFYGKAGFVKAYDQVKDIGNGFVMDDHIMEYQR